MLSNSDALLADSDIVSCLWPLGACSRALWAHLAACPAGPWSHCLGNLGACSGLMYRLKCRHCMALPRWFERYLPALGPAVVSSLTVPNAPGRSPRHVGYWRAFSQLRPHRLLEPARMSPHCQHLQAGAACQQLPHHLEAWHGCQPGAICTVAAGAASCCAVFWQPHGWGPAGRTEQP